MIREIMKELMILLENWKNNFLMIVSIWKLLGHVYIV